MGVFGELENAQAFYMNEVNGNERFGKFGKNPVTTLVPVVPVVWELKKMREM